MSYAIAAGHDATADTAEEILRNGGNAFDAAVAAFMTAFVAEPCMASAGGGAFANIRKADGTQMIFDFFCQTPMNKRPLSEIEFPPIEVDFGTTTEIFHIGRGSVGVPGSVAGIFAMHEALGTIPMRDLVQLPVEYAKSGVAVNAFQYHDLGLLKSILGASSRGRELFYRNGELLKIGDNLKLPHLADFMEVLALEGADLFYKGEVAAKIVAAQRNGGHLTMADFENYKVQIRKPLQFSYRNKTISTNPLPSIGGALIAHYLKNLETMDLSEFPLNELYVRQLYQALRNCDRLDRRPDALEFSLNNLLSGNNKHGSTSHFNIVDKFGNAVSLTTTIGEGCGEFVEGTDIHLNNMLGEAALMPDGFHSWDEDVRLSSMMAPTIVTGADGGLEVVTGTGGASRIPTAITQMLHYLIDYKVSIDEAVNNPRVHLSDGVFNLEPGFRHDFSSDDFEDTLKLWDKQSMFFGGIHSIMCERGALYVSGDERRDGVIRVK